ncbi:MAG: alpha/beta-hydrolase family protein [Actinomycetota bacterium]
MSRLTTIGKGGVGLVVTLANRFNPVVSDPAAPLKTIAFVDAFTPSLMPRASMHQGMAAGMSALAANVVGIGLDSAVRLVVPATSPYTARVGARAAVALGGYALTKIRQTDDEPTSVASARTVGRLALSGGVGGMVYESGEELRARYPASGPIRPVVVGLGSFAGALLYSSKLLENRQAIIKRWSDDDTPASLGGSIGIALAVSTAGRLIGRGFLATRTASQNYFGGDPLKDILGRTINTALWAGGGAALYSAGVGFIARSNEKIEPAYSTVPDNPFVSGGPASVSPFEELGLQGRRFVTDVVTPDLIEGVLGEPAAAHPIRAYIGYNSEPIYTTGRSEMALEELSKLGAFDRKYLLLFAPTGTGWVDQTMIESAEILSRGDIATVCIQYGRSPSFLAVQKVALGRQQFRQLMWGVKQRLAERPVDKRPKVLIFGESLGAWSSSDVVMHQGIEGFDDYGVDRALWFGLPGFAKWSKNGMRDGSSDRIPEGSVGAFDRIEEYNELSDEEKDAMRAVILDHDNDPIAQVSMRLAVKEPAWLRTSERGRNVPDEMEWSPLLTFIQVAVDAMNAMKVIPGEFKSFGHDYRGDTVAFVQAAYHLPALSEEQMENVNEALLRLEVERGERIKQSKQDGAADLESRPKRTRGPKYLRDRRLGDKHSEPIPATPGQPEGDYQ